MNVPHSLVAVASDGSMRTLMEAWSFGYEDIDGIARQSETNLRSQVTVWDDKVVVGRGADVILCDEVRYYVGSELIETIKP